MGVIPTPTNFKTLTFDGENSRSYGVYITGEGVFNAPERNVEMVEIPGRNGAFALDKGNFNNIEVTYPAGIFADTEADFAQAVSDFRNFLCSKVGYVRLEDDYNPNEYRLAIYKSGLEVDHDLLIAGEFDLVFDCKPQRYLKSGETPITIGEWGETTTYTGEIAQFENPNGYLAVKSLVADITPLQDLHGYDKPWVGGAGKNKLPDTRIQGDTTISGVTFTTNSDGSVTMNGTATSTIYYYMIRRNSPFVLPQGEYIVSGLTGSTAMIVIGNAESNIGIGNTNNLQTFTVSESTNVFAFIQISNGTTLNNITAYPMIRLASVTDATYAPWENICPITGWTWCEVGVVGDNSIPLPTKQGYWSGSNGAFVTDPNWVATEKTPCRPNTEYHITSDAAWYRWVAGACYDANGTYIGSVGETSSTSGHHANITITTPNNCYYIGISLAKSPSQSALLPTDVNDLMMNFGSTSSAYVPYNPNSAVYPVSWQTEAGTVYGCTVDVVSGVLTVTHGFKTYDGSESWSTGGTGQGWYTACNDLKKSTDYTTLITSNRLQAYRVYNGYEYTGAVSGVTAYNDPNNTYPTQNWIYAKAPNVSSVSDFKTWLSNNPLQVCYELATTTTHQLTGEQIGLLIGHNNVWNNVGDTSIDVGNDPNSVINPTRFDAQPKLDVYGYGDITFNGFKISIDDGQFGYVNPLINITYPTATSFKLKLNGDIYNIGDPITVSDLANNSSGDGWGFMFGYGTGASLILPSTFVSKTESGSVSASTWGNGLGLNSYKVGITAEFTAGTSATGYASAVYDVKSTDYTTTAGQITATITASYDASDETITITASYVSNIANPNYLCWFENANGMKANTLVNSTKTYIGNPTTVDCEIGEAYKIEGGQIVPLNSYIDLGSELPTLASGANEITYDNTITQLDIVPRWWRV